MPLQRLVVCDARLGDTALAAADRIEGDLADPAVCAAALACEPDIVFHLAAVPGGAAEADYQLGKRVNLDAAMALAEGLRNRANRPRLVMSSSIAVFGSPLPPTVDDDTPPSPALSYGTQKLLLEIYLSDLARRGEIDARLVRLPGSWRGRARPADTSPPT
ncbi:NAD-dependent epimerase/dehydratase family protein [Bradyrhizobium sp. RDT10]